MTGWFKIHRELVEKPIWITSTPEQKVILVTLLSMANFEAKDWEWKGEKYSVKPGQFITSLPSIVQKCGKGISIQNVRTALKRFEKYEFLTDESTKQNRLITIQNWHAYQGLELTKEKNQQTTQQTTNSKLTDDQQTTNSKLTASKKERTKERKNTEEEEEEKRDEKSKNPIGFSKEQMKAITFFSENITMASPIVIDTIAKWVEDFSDKSEIVIAAMIITANNGIRNWSYVESILRDWASKNVKTLEEAKALYESKKKQNTANAKKSRLDELDRLAQGG